MRPLFFLSLFFCVLASACAHVPDRQATAPPPPVTLLISIDGFRADYLQRGKTPVLRALAEDGAWADEGMRPSFPTLTYPNHYTLVTGKRPDKNGVVNNNMEDPAIPGVAFSMSNREAVADGRWWSQADPIWVTAERAGLKTAPIFWPGVEAEIHGVRPSIWGPFDSKKPSAARVDDTLALYDLPEAERPRFATLYFDIVDTAGHWYGPASPELDQAIAEVDAQIGRLVEGLKARGLYDRVNLVIVADHGMAETKPTLYTIAEDWVSPEVARLVASGAAPQFAILPGQEKEAEAKLLGPHPVATCWRKEKVPARFHYGRNPRVPAIVCLANPGGYVVTRKTDQTRTRAPDKGSHGYDPYAIEMYALFIGHGPGFRSGVRLKPFDNVSVYPLLARLIGVKPESGDGRIEDVAPGLR